MPLIMFVRIIGVGDGLKRTRLKTQKTRVLASVLVTIY